MKTTLLAVAFAFASFTAFASDQKTTTIENCVAGSASVPGFNHTTKTCTVTDLNTGRTQVYTKSCTGAQVQGGATVNGAGATLTGTSQVCTTTYHKK